MSIIGNPVTLGGTNTRDATLNSAGQLLDGVIAYGQGGTKYTGNIQTKTSSDLSIDPNNGAKVIAPAGYYASSASKSVASGSAATPATSITANPSISVDSSTGLITASVSASKSITPTVSPGYVSTGTAGTATVSGSATSQLTAKAAATYNTSTNNQTIAPGQYLTGTQTIRAVTTSNITAANIRKGVVVKVGDAGSSGRIINLTGTYEPPVLLVSVTGGTATSVTATKSGVSVTLSFKSTLGKWFGLLPSTGTWTVTASNSSKTKSTTVSASSVTVYEVSISIGNVPGGFVELEYLQSDYNAFINTGITSTNGHRWTGYLKDPGSIGAVAGAASNTSGEKENILSYNSFRNWGWQLGNQTYNWVHNSLTYTSNTKIKFNASCVGTSPFLYVDDQSVSLSYTRNSSASQACVGVPSLPDFIFAMNSNGSMANHGYGLQLFGPFSIFNTTDDTGLVGRFYPAKCTTSVTAYKGTVQTTAAADTLGMYDTVNNRFQINAGEGSFVGGPEV